MTCGRKVRVTTIECKTLIQGLKLVSSLERRSAEKFISKQTTI